MTCHEACTPLIQTHSQQYCMIRCRTSARYQLTARRKAHSVTTTRQLHEVCLKTPRHCTTLGTPSAACKAASSSQAVSFSSLVLYLTCLTAQGLMLLSPSNISPLQECIATSEQCVSSQGTQLACPSLLLFWLHQHNHAQTLLCPSVL